MSKTAYFSPPEAELTLTIIRDSNPTVVITLDVGMPNHVPHFALKFPLVEEGIGGTKVAAPVREALGVMLDEVLAFMQATGYERDVQVQLYAAALACFENMGMASEQDAAMPEYTRDNVVKIYEGTFPMPSAFVEGTQSQVVTAATKVQRVPLNRRIELTKLPPNKTNTYDVEKLIRLYRNRNLKALPNRLFIMVYDQSGNPVGTLSADKFKSQLLKASSIEGELGLPMLDSHGTLYPKGHPIKMVPQGQNQYQYEIHDAETGKPIAKAHVKELVQFAN